MQNILRRVGFVNVNELNTLRATMEKKIEREVRRMQRGNTRQTNRLLQQSYDAARNTRLNNDFRPMSETSDFEVSQALVALRDRARHLCNNNDIAKKFLRLCRKNIPGAYGFTLRMMIKKADGMLDVDANAHFKQKWLDWSKPENCDVTGRHSFRKMQHLAIMHLVRDGEMLIRRVVNKKSKYGFQLQVLEPDLLDESYFKKLDNGNIIVMGVEIDANRRPVAYHLKKLKPELQMFGVNAYQRERERIPAEEMYHYFDSERAFQTRGVSWYAVPMMRLHMLGSGEEHALTAFKIGAAKMGFFSDKVGAEGAEYQGQDTDEEGNTVMSVEGGTFEDIGTKEFQPFDPKYPDAQYEPFVRAIGHHIASGFDTPYPSLFSDLLGVSYSSIRQGELDVRETWMMLQEDQIEGWIDRLFGDWLFYADLFNAFDPKYNVSNDFEKYNVPYFWGKRWDWVDPESDANATMTKLRGGLTSLQREAAKNGDDIEEIFQEIQQIEILKKKYGVTLTYDQKTSAAKPEKESEPINGQSKKNNGTLVPMN